MATRTETKRLQAIVMAFVGYALLLLVMTWKHTFWRDESEVWLIARASGSLSELLRNVRYEGHPLLWYLVQWGFTRFTSNIEWMKVPNVLCAIVTAWMILTSRRLTLPARLGIVFSYYMVFEYGVIARNYMIGIVLLVAAARLMRKGERWSKWVAFLLSLAALTSLPALIVSMFLGLLHLWEVWRDGSGGPLRRLGEVRLAGIFVFTVCALMAAAEIRPPADSGLMLDLQFDPPVSVRHRIAKCGQSVFKAYVPIPRWRPNFWNTTLLIHHFRLEALFGFLLLAGLVSMFRRPAVRCFFIAVTFLEIAQISFSAREQQRHLGWLFIVFVLSLLLERETEHPERSSAGGWRRYLGVAILAGQVTATTVTVWLSFHYTFTASRQLAEFLIDRGLDRKQIAFEPYFISQPVLAYLPQATGYSVERHHPIDFVVWNREEYFGRRRKPSLDDWRAAARSGESPILITEDRLSPEDAAHLRVELLADFGDVDGAIDRYYVYR